MGNITATEVNKLRKATGAGIMDCKNALVESNGDFDLAIENLRKKGQKVAAKRADRESSEGAVIATDFVGKNESFVNLAREISEIALGCDTIDQLFNSNYDNKMSVNEKLTEQTGVIGEKIEIGSFVKIKSNFVGSYIHAGNKIATLVGLSESFEGCGEVAKNIAMQAAAMNPIALDEDGVSKELIEKEIEIAKEQLRSEGKPENMLENIAKGKLKKFFKENTLINQAYIKDTKISVINYLHSVNQNCSISDFKRISLV